MSMHTIGRLGRGLRGLALLAVLGTAAAQPLPPAPAPAARLTCSPRECDFDCVLAGHRGGTCVGGACECWDF